MNIKRRLILTNLLKFDFPEADYFQKFNSFLGGRKHLH